MTSNGLDSYVAKKHFHPLHVLASLVEALLCLFGVVLIILSIYTGSFAKAGEHLDTGAAKLCGLYQDLTHTISNLMPKK